MAADDQSLRRFIPMTTTQSDVDWDAVYRQELPRIYNYLRYRLGQTDLAEDLTSTTFEKAWRARERYRRDLSAFSTWLLTIARNVATDYLRQPHADVPLDAVSEYPAPTATDETVLHQIELQHLVALLSLLPARDRELVALKYGAQLNNREIALQLKLSESNVGTTLHRIVAKLRTQWDQL